MEKCWLAAVGCAKLGVQPSEISAGCSSSWTRVPGFAFCFAGYLIGFGSCQNKSVASQHLFADLEQRLRDF